MMENKGGFERIYPPEKGIHPEPYELFQEIAQNFYDQLTGNDYIRSRGYSKPRSVVSDTQLGGSVRTRQKSLAEIYGVKKVEPKKKPVIQTIPEVQSGIKIVENPSLQVTQQTKESTPQPHVFLPNPLNPIIVPQPTAQGPSSEVPKQNKVNIPNPVLQTPVVVKSTTQNIIKVPSNKTETFHTFIPMKPQLSPSQPKPILSKSIQLKPLKNPKYANPLAVKSNAVFKYENNKTQPSTTEVKEYHMANPLKTENSSSQMYKKREPKIKIQTYNPQFAQTTTHSMIRKNKSPHTRLGSTQNIDNGLRKIPQLNKNHSVSNLRGAKPYRAPKRQYWRKKPKQSGPEYFLSPYVNVDPFLKNLKKIPKLKIMRKEGKF